MYLTKLSKGQLERDIATAKSKNHFEKMDKFYKRIPETTCGRCGVCCLDSPTMTYTEFMYAYDYLASNYDEQTIKETVKRAVKSFMYGLLDKKQTACPCLNEDNSCIIYPRAPVSCKLWGLSSKLTYENNLNADKDKKQEFKKYFSSIGIEIPDGVLDYETPFCEATRTKDVYRLTTRDFDAFLTKDVASIEKNYPRDSEKWSFGNFLLYTFLGKKMAHERIRIVKEYQAGNIEAINQYVETLEL